MSASWKCYVISEYNLWYLFFLIHIGIKRNEFVYVKLFKVTGMYIHNNTDILTMSGSLKGLLLIFCTWNGSSNYKSYTCRLIVVVSDNHQVSQDSTHNFAILPKKFEKKLFKLVTTMHANLNMGILFVWFLYISSGMQREG